MAAPIRRTHRSASPTVETRRNRNKPLPPLPGRLRALWPLILDAARRNTIDPYLLVGLVITESAADTFAVRPEPTFLARYRAGITAVTQRVYGNKKPSWAASPLLLATSYGLTQILAVVALEHGLRLRYPTQLCDPKTNIDLAAEIIAENLAAEGGSLRHALLRYNGGGNRAYPDRVLRNMRRYRRHLEEIP